MVSITCLQLGGLNDIHNVLIGTLHIQVFHFPIDFRNTLLLEDTCITCLKKHTCTVGMNLDNTVTFRLKLHHFQYDRMICY